MCQNYLSSRVYGFDYVKNVDLGNKPKKVQLGYNKFIRFMPKEDRQVFLSNMN